MIQLSSEPIDPGHLLNGFCAGRATTGAVVSFTGLVRDEGGRAQALELEAYEGFTETAIIGMAVAAKARFDLIDLMIVHRIGRVKEGQPIVFVATAAAHRRAALEACDHVMDYLKSRAPLWKKSFGPDGARWIEPTAADLADAKRWDQETNL
jgi:molybdopterin synthase catalytic subunit